MCFINMYHMYENPVKSGEEFPWQLEEFMWFSNTSKLKHWRVKVCLGLEAQSVERVLLFPSRFPKLGREKAMVNCHRIPFADQEATRLLSPCLLAPLGTYPILCLLKLHLRPSQTGDNLLMRPQRPHHQICNTPWCKGYYHHTFVSVHQSRAWAQIH